MNTVSILILVVGTALIVGGQEMNSKREEMDSKRVAITVAILTTLIVGGTIIWYRKRHGLRNAETSASAPISRPASLSPDKCLFVRKRVETYLDEMLCYELRLERNRRGASRAVLQKLLNGKEEVLAMPVLYLNSDEWRWEQQQLQQAVEAALGELGLSVPPDVREPTAQAAHACEQWAAAEAKRLFDEELGNDSREG